MDSRDPLLTTLRETFGFPGFRGGQEQVIRALLDGRSALAIFPTGAGKSLCYQLAALHLPGLTVVVSPLIALMKDQLEFLERHGVPAARVDSSRDAAALRQTAADLRAGRLKLLYASPERLGNERFLATLQNAGVISLLVVDEAHCISEWGHNFRPDYLKLSALAKTLQAERVLALTATATPAVAADIARSFGIAPEDRVHTGFHRPNLFLRVTPSPHAETLGLLTRRLRERSPAGAAVVYVTLQKTAETVAAALAGAGIDARPYHAGLESEERAETQDWFMRGEAPVVVATIAFGMGIDKSNLRAVYHYNLPRAWRTTPRKLAARDATACPPSVSFSPAADDLRTLENFSYGDTPEPGAVAALTDHLLSGEGDTFDVSLIELSNHNDIRPLVVGTLLTYLELAGVIAATAPFYREYTFTPLRPSAEILAKFAGERAEFLREVFRRAKKGTKWLTLDLDEAAATIPGATRDRLVKAFGFLEERGDLTVKPAGLRQAYRRLRRPTGGGTGGVARRTRRALRDPRAQRHHQATPGGGFRRGGGLPDAATGRLLRRGIARRLRPLCLVRRGTRRAAGTVRRHAVRRDDPGADNGSGGTGPGASRCVGFTTPADTVRLRVELATHLPRPAGKSTGSLAASRRLRLPKCSPPPWQHDLAGSGGPPHGWATHPKVSASP